MKLGDIAALVSSTKTFFPNGDLEIQSVAPIDRAGSGHLTFIARDEFLPNLRTTKASAVIVRVVDETVSVAQIVHPEPYFAFAKVAQKFFSPKHPFEGISEQAHIAPSAKVDKSAKIGPFAFVAAGAVIGKNSVIYPNAFVGANTVVGDDVTIYANTVVTDGHKIGNRVLIHAGTVIGGDGFGFATFDKEVTKIPQVGIVVIEDDVEVGAGVTIDRAAMGETRIGRHTKVDSHVHIAHNVRTGECCMISGMVGIAGSAKLGHRVIIGGHAGITGHIEIADDTKIGGMTGVTKSIGEPGGTYLGFPATDARKWRKQQVYMRRLEELVERISALENK